jgi:hypothetical protein
VPPLLLLLAAAGAAFARWGIHTRAGRARFDEMDGILPVAVGIVAALLALAAVAVRWLRSA